MGKNSRDVSAKIPRKRVIKEPEVTQKSTSLVQETISVMLCFFSIFVLLAISSYFSFLDANLELSISRETAAQENMMGAMGYAIAHTLVEYLGYCAFSTVMCIFLVAGLTLRHGSNDNTVTGQRITLITIFCISLILACACMSSVSFGYKGGGYFGTSIAVFLNTYVNKAGTVLMSIAVIVVSLAVLVNLRLDHYFLALKYIARGTKTAARDTSHVLNASVKVGNTALKKTSQIFQLGRTDKKEQRAFTLGSDPDSSEFILGDEDQYLDEEDQAADRSKNIRRSKSRVQKIKKATSLRSRTVQEEDEEEEDEEEEEYEEESEEDEEEDLLFEDEYEEEDDEDEFDEDEDVDDEEGYEDDEIVEEILPPVISRESSVHSKSDKKDKKESRVVSKKTSSEKYSDYQNPSKDLLVGMDGVSVDGPDDQELLENSKKLEVALRNFKLGGRVVEVHPGPIVTLYQFEPAAGIKVQRIINLADDLALALKVESVRVYAPVPGKGTVGIEVPNAEREVVRLRDVVDSEDFSNKPFALALALGKDTYGHAFVADLAKMPHLLIAGSTGTGKSVCINSLLMSLLYKNSPSDLRLILIDPKMLELSIYESIPHLLAPVVTNPKRARGVLYWAVEEMERRYEMMKEYGVRDMAMFNRMVGEGDAKPFQTSAKKKNEVINLEEKDVLTTTAAQAIIDRNGLSDDLSQSVKGLLEPLPRIVIVVDELADLMLTVGKEIEELLTRLAQKARAAGIHLILATQRPSVNVITGLIKANFPARISFKVASKIDARTVMDSSGAERLLGQGDMLFLSPSVGRVKRLHSPFVSDQEVHDVVSWIRSQGEPDYDVRIEKTLKTLEEQEQKGSDGDVEGAFSEYDPLYDQAVNMVLEKGQASTSMVQRVFRIGYNRAARILEMMEREGVVGPADGAKPRQVLLNTLDRA